MLSEVRVCSPSELLGKRLPIQPARSFRSICSHIELIADCAPRSSSRPVKPLAARRGSSTALDAELTAQTTQLGHSEPGRRRAVRVTFDRQNPTAEFRPSHPLADVGYGDAHENGWFHIQRYRARSAGAFRGRSIKRGLPPPACR